MIDAELIKLILMSLNALASIILFFYVRADSQQRATVASIKELEEKMAARFEEKSQHIGRLEIEIQRYPSRDTFEKERDTSRIEIVRIHERMDDLNKTAQQTQLLLGEVYGQLKQLNNNRNGHG